VLYGTVRSGTSSRSLGKRHRPSTSWTMAIRVSPNATLFSLYMLTLALAQGHIAKILKEVFNIETGFHGTLISAFARLNLDHVVDEVNDETLDPWAELQQEAGISQSTPLSPFMEKELLRDADLSMDGSAFEKDTGFT
jgi:hypothetical protein